MTFVYVTPAHILLTSDTPLPPSHHFKPNILQVPCVLLINRLKKKRNEQKVHSFCDLLWRIWQKGVFRPRGHVHFCILRTHFTQHVNLSYIAFHAKSSQVLARLIFNIVSFFFFLLPRFAAVAAAAAAATCCMSVSAAEIYEVPHGRRGTQIYL